MERISASYIIIITIDFTKKKNSRGLKNAVGSEGFLIVALTIEKT